VEVGVGAVPPWQPEQFDVVPAFPVQYARPAVALAAAYAVDIGIKTITNNAPMFKTNFGVIFLNGI
jgi:hypothetical protein